MNDEYFDEREKTFWEEVKRRERSQLVSYLVGSSPVKKLPVDEVGLLAWRVHHEKTELAIAEKILENTDKNDPKRRHADANVGDKKQRLYATQTNLASAEVKKKMFPTVTKWDEHELEARFADKRSLRSEFRIVHAEEDFVRSTLESVLKEKRSDKALAIAKASNRIAKEANNLATTANENADMANSHVRDANGIARAANDKSSCANWIAGCALILSAIAAGFSAYAALTP